MDFVCAFQSLWSSIDIVPDAMPISVLLHSSQWSRFHLRTLSANAGFNCFLASARIFRNRRIVFRRCSVVWLCMRACTCASGCLCVRFCRRARESFHEELLRRYVCVFDFSVCCRLCMSSCLLAFLCASARAFGSLRPGDVRVLDRSISSIRFGLNCQQVV